MDSMDLNGTDIIIKLNAIVSPIIRKRWELYFHLIDRRQHVGFTHSFAFASLRGSNFGIDAQGIEVQLLANVYQPGHDSNCQSLSKSDLPAADP